jgi:hypothetical protein
MRRYVTVGFVALVLAFPLALGTLRVLYRPSCTVTKVLLNGVPVGPPQTSCLIADLWSGQYPVLTSPPNALMQPPLYSVWAGAAAALWLVLMAFVRLRTGALTVPALRRYVVVGLVAVVLSFPLALETLRVLSPPICSVVKVFLGDGVTPAGPDQPFCMNANPWTGRYIPDWPGVPGDAGRGLPAQPTMYPVWATATLVLSVLLLRAGRLRTTRAPFGRARYVP